MRYLEYENVFPFKVDEELVGHVVGGDEYDVVEVYDHPLVSSPIQYIQRCTQPFDLIVHEHQEHCIDQEESDVNQKDVLVEEEVRAETDEEVNQIEDEEHGWRNVYLEAEEHRHQGHPNLDHVIEAFEESQEVQVDIIIDAVGFHHVVDHHIYQHNGIDYGQIGET